MQLDTELQRRQIEERAFQERMKYFLERYTPEDRETAYDFHADLHSLIHTLQIDLSANFTRHLTQIISTQQKVYVPVLGPT